MSEIEHDFTYEDLYVIYLVLRNTPIDMFDTPQDAERANRIYRTLKEYFLNTPSPEAF